MTHGPISIKFWETFVACGNLSLLAPYFLLFQRVSVPLTGRHSRQLPGWPASLSGLATPVSATSVTSGVYVARPLTTETKKSLKYRTLMPLTQICSTKQISLNIVNCVLHTHTHTQNSMLIRTQVKQQVESQHRLSLCAANTVRFRYRQHIQSLATTS